jgi:hypothetical protein
MMILPFTRRRSLALLHKLNQEDTAMNEPTTQPEPQPTPAQKAMIESLAWQMFDLRLAAVLNMMDVARTQGDHRDWTDVHAAQIRHLMGVGDQIVAGDPSAIVPSGFGEPIRTKQTEALERAMALASGKMPAAKGLAAPDEDREPAMREAGLIEPEAQG